MLDVIIYDEDIGFGRLFFSSFMYYLPYYYALSRGLIFLHFVCERNALNQAGRRLWKRRHTAADLLFTLSQNPALFDNGYTNYNDFKDNVQAAKII